VSVKFSIQLFPYSRWATWSAMKDAVLVADKLGFYSVRLPDHVGFPDVEEARPVGEVFPDCIVLASHLAAVTASLRMQLYAMVVPYRHPIHAAKMLSTLDQVSNGRTIVTIGSGWMEREFQALGVDYQDRGPITDSYLRSMIEIWTQKRATIRTPHVSFDNLISEPKCVQYPHVPLWIGGNGPAARRRVREFGAGWCPLVGSISELKSEIARVRNDVAESGRDAGGLEFGFQFALGRRDEDNERARAHVEGSTEEAYAPDPDAALQLIARYADAGVTNLEVTLPWRSPGHFVELLEAFGEEVMSRVSPVPA
jgi:probable F420-dependent oxidoreductase